MSDMNCQADLNAQLQGLESRLRTAEQSIAANTMLSKMIATLALPTVPTLSAVVALLTVADPIRTIISNFSSVLSGLWLQQLQLSIENMAVSAFDTAIAGLTAQVSSQISAIETSLITATGADRIALLNQLAGATAVANTISGFIENQKKIGACQTTSAQISKPSA